MAGPNPFADIVPSTTPMANPFADIVPSTTPAANPFADIVPNTVEKQKEDEARQYKSLHSVDWAKDALRTALQGFTLGHGDEILAWLRAKAEGGSYEQKRKEEREAVKRFGKEHGPGATATEIAGGLALPFGPMAKLFQGATTVGKVAKAVPLGYGTGFVSGVGASEKESAGELVEAGHDTGKVGAVIAPAVPVVGQLLGGATRKADTAAQSALNAEKGAQLYLADKLRAAGLTEAQIIAELERGLAAASFYAGKAPGQVAEEMLLAGKADDEILRRIKATQTAQANAQAPLPETIADVAPALQRTVRGIKVGGDADHVVEPFLAGRQAGAIDFTKGAEAGGQHARLSEQTRLALRVSDDALPDKLEKMTAKAGQRGQRAIQQGRSRIPKA